MLSTPAASSGRTPGAAANESVGWLSFRWRHPGTLRITSSSGSPLALGVTFKSEASTAARIARESYILDTVHQVHTGQTGYSYHKDLERADQVDELLDRYNKVLENIGIKR